MLHSNKIDFLFIQDTDIYLIAAPQKFNGNHVFQHATVIHVLCPQSGKPEALVGKIVFVLRTKISLSSDVISPDSIKGKGLAEGINVFAHGLVINLALVRGQGVRDRSYRSDIANIVHQKINQFMEKWLISKTVFCHDISDDEGV